MTEKKRLSPEEFLQFNEEILGLVKTDTPLPEGLKRFGMELNKGTLKNAVENVHQGMKRGLDLSEAVRGAGKAFDPYYVGLLRAGEAAGSLDEILYQSLREAKSRIRFHQSLKMVTMYPMILGIFCLAVIIFILVYVVPGIDEIFSRLGAYLPAPTQFMVDLSDIFIHKTWIPLLITGLLIFIYEWGKSSARGRYLWEVFLLSCPVTRELASNYFIETFTRSLGNLLRAGAPMDEALALTRENIRPGPGRGLVERMQRAIEKGNPLSSTLKKGSPLLSNSLCWMLSLAEQRGSLDGTLLEIAEITEGRRESVYQRFVALLEPMLILLLGIIIGFMVVCFYLPYFMIPMVIG